MTHTAVPTPGRKGHLYPLAPPPPLFPTVTAVTSSSVSFQNLTVFTSAGNLHTGKQDPEGEATLPGTSLPRPQPRLRVRLPEDLPRAPPPSCPWARALAVSQGLGDSCPSAGTALLCRKDWAGVTEWPCRHCLRWRSADGAGASTAIPTRACVSTASRGSCADRPSSGGDAVSLRLLLRPLRLPTLARSSSWCHSFFD